MRLASGFALVCAAAIMCVSPAFAAFTTVNPPTYANEDSHAQILSTVYGGSFSSTGSLGLDYTNGSITALRIEDTLDLSSVPTGLTPQGSALPTLASDDQLWQADFQSASAKAIFASFSQQFGYIDGASGGTYTNLFNSSGTGYGVTGSIDLSALSGHLLRWARNGDNGVESSQNSDNLDGLDHMVTYSIQGLNNGLQTWLVFFEDLRSGQQYADFDYNDLVVQITALPVPEPTAMAGLLAAASLGFGLRRRKQT